MNHSQLSDLLIIAEWLAATKTPPPNIAAAFDRLRERVKEQHANAPAGIKILDSKVVKIAEDE